MKDKKKKELILEGLNCASCASKIESKINQLEDVHHASLNFVTKTLNIEMNTITHIDRVIDEVRDIVMTLEPHVIVKEKHIDKSAQKTLVLMGLICTSCASKIEEKIKALEGVKEARINFSTGKLVIETYSQNHLDTVGEQATQIINKIEPDVKIIDEDDSNKKRDNHDIPRDSTPTKELIRMMIGVGIFAIAIGFKLSYWLEFSLFLVSYILIGGEILLKAIRNIFRGQVFDENFLMSIATIGAFAIGEFPEGVAVMLFYQIGEFFQDLAVNRSRRSIQSLMDIRPDYANLKQGNETKKVSPQEVAIGDLVIIKSGERVPLDGKVIEGESRVDTSALTGESVPRKIKPGETILGGFINKGGLLTVEITKVFGESTVSRILEMVENASGRKAPTEQFITKFSRYYTPIVVYSALALAIIPPLILTGATFSEWIYRALIFLVISCPCALVVSIPLGFFGGIGGASRSGILVKGGNYLEALNHVGIAVFDKTGTLTKGVFEVTGIHTLGEVSQKDLLKYAAYAENYSSHPIATSILKKYGQAIHEEAIESYNEISGHGIKAKVSSQEILVGNAKLMEKEGILHDPLDTIGTIVYIAIDGNYAGHLVISDEIKEDAKQSLQSLKAMGIKKVVMLTGDNRRVGEKIGQELGLDEIYTECLPDEKVAQLELLDKQKGPKDKLIFVGDGINDAPVLARADIGIAMGGLGSDAAIEAADVVLMTDEPSKLVTAIKIAKKTRKIVLQNIVFALGVKVFVLALGAFGFATMWAAVFADVGVALIAILNALRVLRMKKI